MHIGGRKRPAPTRPPVTWWTYTWGDYVTWLVWSLPISVALVWLTRGFGVDLAWALGSGVAWIVLVITFAKLWESWRSRRNAARSSQAPPAEPSPSSVEPLPHGRRHDDAITVGEIATLVFICLCAGFGGLVGLLSTGNTVAMLGGAAVFGGASLCLVIVVSFAVSGIVWFLRLLVRR